MPLEYVTNREISDKNGEVKGKLKIMKLKEESEASVELKCPACGQTAKWRESWTEPFVTGEKSNQKFFVKCRQCDFSAKLMKLKKEAKKESKKDLKK